MKAYEATIPKQKPPKKNTLPAEPDVPGTARWAGTTRFQTVRETTHATWPPGVEGCFVVSVEPMTLGRMVAPIAAARGWPMLWVRPGSIPGATRDELGRLVPERVVVVGDEEQVSAKIFNRIEKLVPGGVERVGSADPALTAAQLVTAFPPPDRSTVYVSHMESSGSAPVASLDAARTGRALVVCDAEGAPEELVTALAHLGPGRLAFLGHEEEWPTDTIDRLRDATGAEVTALPQGGPMALAAGLWADAEPGGRVIVSGASAIEMLPTAVAAGHTGTPMLLLTSGRLPDLVRRALERLEPSEIVLSGAVDTLPTDLLVTLGALVSGRTGTTEAPGPQ